MIIKIIKKYLAYICSGFISPVIMIKPWPKTIQEREGFIWFIVTGHNPSLVEVKAGSQSRNLKAGLLAVPHSFTFGLRSCFPKHGRNGGVCRVSMTTVQKLPEHSAEWDQMSRRAVRKQMRHHVGAWRILPKKNNSLSLFSILWYPKWNLNAFLSFYNTHTPPHTHREMCWQERK